MLTGLKEPNWQLLWGRVHLENENRKAAMAWAADKLAKLEAELALTRKRMEYHEATLRAVRHAISDDNPKLKS
jgi:hypothetical protein